MRQNTGKYRENACDRESSDNTGKTQVTGKPGTIPGKRRPEGNTGQYREKLEKQEKTLKPVVSGFRVLRAGNENRTRDLRTTNATHYRLCYASILFVAVFATNEYYHV